MPSSARPSRLWPALIVLAGAATYANGLTNPFIFDDFGSVVRNPTIRDLTDLETVLSPPADTSVAHRPLVNLSFAVNYAIGELHVIGYRILNLALHLACALLIFAIARRTLVAAGSGGTRVAPSPRAAVVAGTIALVWVVHPLNSEVVDYISERSDSMMALCLLAALYASAYAQESSRPLRWRITSVASCAAGMACKETMVVAPIVILLYDGIYLAGGSVSGIGAALRARWRYYAALAATWALLVPSVLSSASISSGGFSSAEATSWTYLLNQTEIVTRYFRLAIWPSSLVNYYGWARPLTLTDVWIPAAFLTAIAFASVVWFLKAPRVGVLAVWVFVLLAPTSSIIAIAAEVGAERRMYLPLVCIVALAIIGLDRMWRAAKPVLWVVGAMTVVLAIVTTVRNREYSSALTMARTVLARWPTPMAHHLVGAELSFAGRRDEAIAELSIAARDYAPARYYLGRELGAAERFDDAVEALQAFVRDEPRAPVVPMAHGLIADALVRRQRVAEAIPHYRIWLEADRSNATAWSSLALALLRTGRLDEAAGHAQQAVSLRPAEPVGHDVLARILAAQGKIDDARREFSRALELDPNYAPAREGLRLLGVK